MSSLRVSPRKKALNRTAQAIISGTPRARPSTRRFQIAAARKAMLHKVRPADRQAWFRKPGDAAGERAEGIIRTDDHQRSRKQWLAIPSTQPEPALIGLGTRPSAPQPPQRTGQRVRLRLKDDHSYAMRYAAMSTPGFSDQPVVILVSTYLKGAHPEPGRFLPETHTAQDRDRPGCRRDGLGYPETPASGPERPLRPVSRTSEAVSMSLRIGA